MSFGPNKQTQGAADANTGIAKQATANSANELNSGDSLVSSGQGTVNQGTNFFNTLLNGNRANTTSLLQPNIDQIRDTNSSNLSAISALSPRGGGRSGSLFGAAYAPSQQINSLYGGARSGAASGLAQIGLGQEGIGTSLVGAGNGALNTGANTNQGLLQYGLDQQKQTAAQWAGLGNGLFNLATTPFGGSATNLLQRI